jgi:flagellar motor switch protein FliM
LETVPNTIKIAPVSEMTALVTLSVKIIRTDGIVKGMINFCIPYHLVEPILRK